jgi:hypothetical protein
MHFVTVFQMVDDQYVGVPAFVKLRDQVTANEAGAAGDDDHRCRGS